MINEAMHQHRVKYQHSTYVPFRILYMLIQKQKNIVPYQLYAAKKKQSPDHLCSLIRKQQKQATQQIDNLDQNIDPAIKKLMNEKRIQQIVKEHKKNQVSTPTPYIKRTWVSPIQITQNKQGMLYCFWKKNIQKNPSDHQKIKNVCHFLYMNKKVHLCGDFMYCDFQQKQNRQTPAVRCSEKKIEGLHRQFEKLQVNSKKTIIICNKGSSYNKKSFVNPLKDDEYFQIIIKSKDEELVRLLIDSLSSMNSFVFSSYLAFYELFVWQQVDKNTQIQFVIKVLMSSFPEVTFKKLADSIDFMCSKIHLTQNTDSLEGFNEVMKKLIFGTEYENCESEQKWLTRNALRTSLESNEECISILINVFYCE